METSDNPERLGIAMIGDGLMAKAHTMAWRNVQAVYGDVPVEPELRVIVHPDESRARAAADQYGFQRWATSWQDAVDDPEVDVVDIVTPNAFHKDVAIAAAHAGKHIWCEKPLALTVDEAREMTEAAEAAGVQTLVGFTYVRNPALELARQLVEAGEIGETVSVAGVFSADTMIDPTVPFTWRTDRDRAGGGAFADLGSHLVSITQRLVGDIARVSARSVVVVDERLDADQVPQAVTNDDLTMSMVEFRNGALGTLWASRVATGSAFELSMTVTGTEGVIRFNQQDIYKLEVKLASDPSDEHGFRVVEVGPGHGDYEHLWPMSGINLGIHELKLFEVRDLIQAIVSGTRAMPDFRSGWQVQKVIAAVESSASTNAWTDVE